MASSHSAVSGTRLTTTTGRSGLKRLIASSNSGYRFPCDEQKINSAPSRFTAARHSRGSRKGSEKTDCCWLTSTRRSSEASESSRPNRTILARMPSPSRDLSLNYETLFSVGKGPWSERPAEQGLRELRPLIKGYESNL